VRSLTRGSRVGAAVVFACLAFASTAVAASDRYLQHNIVSSTVAIPADRIDANLINPWGLVSSATSPWWPVNEGSNTSLIYPANGSVNNTVVQVAGKPTGIVAGGIANNFLITGGTANFIFSAKNGQISGWRGGAVSEVKVPAGTAYYTGLAIATTASGPMLYAPDFRNRKIDVFNGQWAPQALPAGAFTDPGIPADYAPYGVQTVGSRIFVTYAQQIPNLPEEEFPGPGKGYVDAFDTAGTLLGRVASAGSVLNAPWGTAQAPAGFGAFEGDLLIGNFGDGHINAYKEGPANTWTLDGTLKNAAGNPLFIQGLWAIQFGHGTANNGSPTTLYFVAGPGGERQGVFGRLEPTSLTDVTATVPAQLSLNLGPAVSFGAFTPGVGKDYDASTTATVTSTAGDATLSVADPSATATGHLVNGTFSLPQALKAGAASTGATAGPLADVGGSSAPTALLTYTGPVSSDNVTLSFRQTIGAGDALRTGSYTKTLTFTLSTTAP
jgi:uncharacterized protein (TIGR03118 family)